MESEDAKPTSSGTNPRGGGGPRDDEGKRVRVKRKSVQTVLEQCLRTLEMLREAELGGGIGQDEEEEEERGDREEEKRKDEKERPVLAVEEEGECNSSVGDASTTAGDDDSEVDELCDLLKSRLESPNFLERLGSIHKSVLQNHMDESASWDLVTARDLWEDKSGDLENGSEEAYVLVSQEDIVDGVACFMAAYLLSLKETKDMAPDQLQEALSKTFSVKKKKGKLRKAWDGSKVIYNVASWSATAIGIYQNPALLKVASTAFWTSCRVIAKLF